MARKHYHVLLGTNGYMPDTNNAYPTKRDAQYGLRFWRDHIKECSEGTAISGSIRSGYFQIRPEPDDPYTLNQYLEIVDCFEDDCLEGDSL